jgi:hypothetical protein
MNCAYCKTSNECWLAPTCGFYTFECKKCHKNTFIADTECVGFVPKKCEAVTYQEVKDQFINATSIMWEAKDLDRICKENFKNIKNMNKPKKKRR